MLRHCLLPLLLLPVLTGCGTSYLVQAGRGEWQLLHARQPISRLLASDATDSGLKAELRVAQSARDFAVSTLHLPDNDSYRSFSALGRPYVVWNVVAAPEFSVTPRHWCFPFTGCIAYRGYFHEESARRYAAQLQAEGFDVQIGGVAAFSTLGKFADPVLDTMLRYGEAELAGTLFHELAHQRVYIKNDSAFNEAFAMAVEQAGLQIWLQQQSRTDELARVTEWRRSTEAVSDLLVQGRARLGALYAAPLPAEEKRQRKGTELASLARAVLDLEQQRGMRSVYGEWARAGLNNAHLASVATYHACVPAFLRLLAAEGGDWPRFYAAADRIGHQEPAVRQQFCAAG
jgi:predicted aminopeptidase